MQRQAVKSIPGFFFLAFPYILFKKQLKKKKTLKIPAQLSIHTTEPFLQAGAENKIDVRNQAAMNTLGKCF